MAFLIYKKNYSFAHNCITAMIATEIRAIIQSWRKNNKLPISYHVPTLKVYFKEDIIKTALIEGITDVNTKNHLFDTCLIDNVEFEELPEEQEGHDFYCWSPLGGNVGYGDPLKGNTNLIQNAIDEAIKNKRYTQYL